MKTNEIFVKVFKIYEIILKTHEIFRKISKSILNLWLKEQNLLIEKLDLKANKKVENLERNDKMTH